LSQTKAAREWTRKGETVITLEPDSRANIIPGPFPAADAPPACELSEYEEALPVHQTNEGKVPHRVALVIARRFVEFLSPHCHRVAIAGSLRREKALVNDIEILFIPRVIQTLDPSDLFRERMIGTSAADRALQVLLDLGLVTKRPNVDGVCSWGPKNKLGVHASSGIAVDFFAATPENWFNYLVCRTGGAETNVRIASAAQRLGWKWHPYGDGFSRLTTKERRVVSSEREVFGFVNLPYLEPKDR
jgi:DNA polymerase/3'-5' exonuclease PolX